ncbi:MAG: GNAT family N-acetyltransferase [Planctomycetota bacterium]|jgi:ribosomal protein S18 acetylase RimI-like enzyme
METPPLIREAVEADLDEIVQVCQESIAETYGSFIDRKKIEPWVHGDEVRKFATANRRNMLVAVVGGRILGVVSVTGDMIDLLWVKIGHRGRSIGAVLMEKTEARIFAESDKARVECFEPNTASLAFYEGRGFFPVETHFDEESGVNKVLMEKEAPRS